MNHSKQLNTAQFLNDLHQLIDSQLQQAISVYQNLSEGQLNKPSPTGGWSIAQCLEHLNSYGRHYLPLIEKAVNPNTGHTVAIVKRGWLGNYLIKMMDPQLKPAKYKALKTHLPADNLNACEVVAEFISQQETLIKLLRTVAHSDLNGIRITTSISPFIRLRLGDTLAFMVIHNERHIQQANRNIPVN